MAEALVTVKRIQNKTLVSFGANLDVAAAASLKSELGKILKRKPPFELDGSEVERVDAAGLQVLLKFLTENRDRDREVSWSKASDALRAASKLSGLAAGLGLDG